MAYLQSYSNQRFDVVQQAAARMSTTPGYTKADCALVERVIEAGSGRMPSPRSLADAAIKLRDEEEL